MVERLADRLAARRRDQFVGRGSELALFEQLLRRSQDQGGAVLFVHGPGGVGKSTLLRRMEWLGGDAGRRTVLLDARDVAPIPSSFTAALVARLGGATKHDGTGQELTELVDQADGLILLVDTAELLAPLDRWLREELLPGLRSDTITVFAGRDPPGLAWRTDPGWRSLLHAVRLDNLTREESEALLAACGVPLERREEALAFTRGHPLALALVADVMAQRSEPLGIAAMPGVLTGLLGSLVDSVPTTAHRLALEACAQVLTTTEPLLARLLEVDDAHEVFDWLRGLSIVETGPRGLFPHDVAREALGAELLWRRPEQHAEIHRRAGSYYRERFYAVPSEEQQQVLVEYVFLHRDNPVLGPFVTGSAEAGLDLRSLVATPAAPSEQALAHEIVERHEGAEAAALVDYWAHRQPGCVRLVRGPDGDVLGLVCTVAMQDVDPADRRRDVAVDRVATFLDRLPELAPDEVAGFFRFWMRRDGYQDLGPVQLFITLCFVRYYLSTRRLAYSFVYYADPGLWADICAYADVHRLAEADFTMDGRRYGVYWHDWRTRPPLAWLELLGEREVASSPLAVGEGRVAATVPVGVRRLSEEEFRAAVKEALKGLGRADGLRGSALLDTALVVGSVEPDAGERARTEALGARLREAARRLQESPRDRRAFRALHHTYLQPAPTQSEAAELLDLPMSTYRRHLAEGVERLTGILRQEETDRLRAGRVTASEPARDGAASEP
jgi:hypothetical protein